MGRPANGELKLGAERLAFVWAPLELDRVPVRVLQFDGDCVLLVGRRPRDLNDDAEAECDIKGS